MSDLTSRPRWSTATKFFISAALLAFLVYLLARFNAIVPVLVLASILAYVLSPVVGWIQSSFRIRRGLATVVVYIILIGLVAVVPALVIPILVDRLTRLSIAFEEIIANIEGFLGKGVVIGDYRIDAVQIVEQVVTTLRGLIEPLFGQTLNIVVNLISSLASGVFLIVISFYLVKDEAWLRKWAVSLPPPQYRQDFRLLWSEVNAIWSAFFRGQIILAVVVAAIFIVVGTILGLPFALALGFMAGLLEFIPSLGHAIWLAIASFLTFFLGSSWIPLPNWMVMLLVIGLHLIFVQFDLNFLIPRIIGSRVHLHPLVIILGIIAGATLAGVLGVVLAAPTIATSRVLGRYLISNLLDQDPFAQG